MGNQTDGETKRLILARAGFEMAIDGRLLPGSTFLGLIGRRHTKPKIPLVPKDQDFRVCTSDLPTPIAVVDSTRAIPSVLCRWFRGSLGRHLDILIELVLGQRAVRRFLSGWSASNRAYTLTKV